MKVLTRSLASRTAGHEYLLFSSQPSEQLPNSWADRLIKKTGHVLGYAMLAGYWYALESRLNTAGTPGCSLGICNYG
jgi:hypothetical protein